jgi:hypothetical protein
VQARHCHRVIREKLFDPFPKRVSDPVTQFDALEAEREDFIQHGIAASVAVRIPASGEG